MVGFLERVGVYLEGGCVAVWRLSQRLSESHVRPPFAVIGGGFFVGQVVCSIRGCRTDLTGVGFLYIC